MTAAHVWILLLLPFSCLAVTPVPYPCVDEACRLPGHDPSALQRTSAGYYVTLVTGSGAGDAFGMKYLTPNDYGAGWLQGEYSYLHPDWLRDYGPWPDQCDRSKDKRNVCPFWGPDIVSSGNGIAPGGDTFILYYSVPRIADGDGQGCIGHAIGKFHAPTRRSRAMIKWTDAGQPVICTNTSTPGPHNIDPSVMVDADGRWWLSYGSYSSTGENGGGIWMIELNSKNGMLNEKTLRHCGDKYPYCWMADDPNFRNVANNPSGGDNSLEASYLYHHEESDSDKRYFLFVNWYGCCNQMDSTYEIRVGRSASPTGPFVDKNGRSMAHGGGELLLQRLTKGNTSMVGPGHAGVFRDRMSGDYILTFDFQGIQPGDGEYKTQARKLFWAADGWPVVSNANFVPKSGHIIV